VGADEGSFWVVFLKPNGKARGTRSLRREPGRLRAGSQLGRDIANVGDIDDDGIVDVAVGRRFTASLGRIAGSSGPSFSTTMAPTRTWRASTLRQRL